MGLDMYLIRKIYLETNNKKLEPLFYKDDEGKLIPVGVDQEKIKEITEDRIYWRKANSIHDWFVRNVQDNNDDCGTYYVTREDLKALFDECEKVLKNPELASTVLPTKSGFFFGNYDYDEDYFEDITYTRNKLKEILDIENDKGYSSSW